eukprot:TRINITY_DN1652_c0_g1_i1.p1 TRINITY_DN1652_c0_g1~~TRINITY_DN1652_c0_g1_i1.p1  ORF type:complete len:177 (-),score=67.65 TRINITY_DN1652_c0_g1_i1:57-587(-)
MVEAWLMDDSNEDQRATHRQNPNVEVSLKELEELGMLYFNVKGEDDPEFHKLCADRGYNYTDTVVISPEKLPNYEEKIKIFFTEHIHDDEEIRLCLEGSGYFDIRDKLERWVRVKVVPGDILILPAGSYHRFTLDENNFIVAKRMFVGEPIWTPYNRPADERPARAQYLSQIGLSA